MNDDEKPFSLFYSPEQSQPGENFTFNSTINLEYDAKSVLKKHSIANGELGFNIFNSETLPNISKLYDYTDVFVDNETCSDSIEIDHSDTSERSSINSLTSATNSIEDHVESKSSKLSINYELTVKCLQSKEELKKECDKLGVKFVDCLKQDGRLAWANTIDLDRNMKDPSVNCLQSKGDLIKKCKKLGLIFVDFTKRERQYEVDLILGNKIEEGQKYYLVKWKFYDLKYNTWEPDYHLSGCQDLISYYEALKSSSAKPSIEHFHHFIRDLTSRRPYDIPSLVKVLSIVNGSSKDDVHKLNLTMTQLRLKVKEILDFPLHKIANIKNKLIAVMRFADRRRQVLVNLKEWENGINSYNPATYIEVENNVDLEEAPTDFQFIHDYVADDIPISQEPAVFCSCDNCYECKGSCCPHDSDANFPYNRYRRNQLLPGYPIYECNKMCRCGKDCVNRVVQHGQKVKVAIFRTTNGCGWGLKTLETIQKDQFVLEYLGEILTSEAAEIRGNVYDHVGRSYLFDLDYGEENCKYTVDAGHLGNAAHFINHSCNPNLHVFAVWINNQDPQLPRLAFFAKKKINRGEELTFDYKMVKNHDRFGPLIPSEERMLCKCDSRNCRKYLF